MGSLSSRCSVGLLLCYCKYWCLCSSGGNSHPRQEKEGRAQQHSGCNEKGCCQEGVTCIIGQINLYLQIYSFVHVSYDFGHFCLILTAISSCSNGVSFLRSYWWSIIWLFVFPKPNCANQCKKYAALFKRMWAFWPKPATQTGRT